MSYRGEIFNEIEKMQLNVDLDKIKMAYELAKESHQGQLRKSGEEYIIHPIEVSKILIAMKMDTDTIVAGLLHDVIEDTDISRAMIEEKFGVNVARLVDGVTKLKHLPETSSKQTENIRKMIVAMAKDVRVVIIKLADRLHNMRTLKHMIPEKQKRISEETLNIYAPLAHRLGMAKMKWELEDLSLYYIKPKIYREIIEMINSKRAEREEYTEEVMKIIREELVKYELKGEVTGRPKHFYSIYKKIYEKDKSFDELYDLIAMRIIVETEAECYNALGIIHNIWKPVPRRFKDYLAVPKSNGYQSIHTTVVGPDGKFVEIQIRTIEMHRIAEEGIAAHWKYKEKVKNGKSENIYSWLRKILDWQQEADNSEEFVETVTGDLLNDEVFVFSPKGDVIELAKNSTPLDFAFYIHTEVGYKCVGAKVNNKIVPLDYKLENGDRVEIITSKNSKGPGKDWSKIVATHSAKSKIRKWFKEQQYVDKIKFGKSIIEQNFAMVNIKPKEIENLEEVKYFIKKNNLPNYDELLFGIGMGKISIERLIEKFRPKEDIQIEIPKKEDENRNSKKNKKKNDYGVIVDGVDNIIIRFAKCCTPLPGDDIGGYVSRGKGIAIHRFDCQNYQSLIENEPGRKIGVTWDMEHTIKANTYSFKFNIIVIDRVNILKEIINLISEGRINILAVSSVGFKDSGEKRASITLTVELSEKDEYEKIIRSLNKIEDVISVRRN